MAKLFSLLIGAIALIFSIGCDTVNTVVDNGNLDIKMEESDSDTSGSYSRGVPISGTWHHVQKVNRFNHSGLVDLKAHDLAASPVANQIAFSTSTDGGMLKGAWIYNYTPNTTNMSWNGGDHRIGGSPCQGIAMDRDGNVWSVQDMGFVSWIWCRANNGANIYSPSFAMDNPYSNALDIGCGVGAMTNTNDPLYDKGIIMLGKNGYNVYRLCLSSSGSGIDFKLIDNLNVAQGAYLGRRLDAAHSLTNKGSMVLVDNYKQARISDSYRQYVWWNALDTEKAMDIAIEPTTAQNPEIWMIGEDNSSWGGRIYRWNYSTNQWDEAGGRASRITIDRHGKPWLANEIGDVFCWY